MIGSAQTNHMIADQHAHKNLLEATIAYGIFFAFSLLGRLIPSVFYLVMITGIAFPFVWAAMAHNWAAIGLTRCNAKRGALWGTGIGVGLGGLTYLVLTSQGRQLAQHPSVLQLVISVVLSFLIISPFQEFFFRGWLQPRFQDGLGEWAGLLTCSLCFAVWDVMPLLNSSFSLTTVASSLAMIPASFGFTVVFGYSFQRTGSILAPWLAHGLVVVALLLTGQLVLFGTS